MSTGNYIHQLLVNLVNLLKAMSKELRDWTWLQGYQVSAPILLINEVNKLRELVKIDPKGQKTLENIFAWFVAMTKEVKISCNLLFQ